MAGRTRWHAPRCCRSASARPAAWRASWGFDLGSIAAPVLVVGGTDDHFVPASHARWLAGHCPGATLRLEEGDGHLSILRHGASLLAWLQETAAG